VELGVHVGKLRIISRYMYCSLGYICIMCCACARRFYLTVNIFTDEELPDYIMVLVANRRTKPQMESDLILFLGDNTSRFVSWLYFVLKKLEEVTANLPAGSIKPATNNAAATASTETASSCKATGSAAVLVTSKKKVKGDASPLKVKKKDKSKDKTKKADRSKTKESKNKSSKSSSKTELEKEIKKLKEKKPTKNEGSNVQQKVVETKKENKNKKQELFKPTVLLKKKTLVQKTKLTLEFDEEQNQEELKKSMKRKHLIDDMSKELKEGEKKSEADTEANLTEPSSSKNVEDEISETKVVTTEKSAKADQDAEGKENEDEDLLTLKADDLEDDRHITEEKASKKQESSEDEDPDLLRQQALASSSKLITLEVEKRERQMIRKASIEERVRKPVSTGSERRMGEKTSHLRKAILAHTDMKSRNQTDKRRRESNSRSRSKSPRQEDLRPQRRIVRTFDPDRLGSSDLRSRIGRRSPERILRDPKYFDSPDKVPRHRQHSPIMGPRRLRSKSYRSRSRSRHRSRSRSRSRGDRHSRREPSKQLMSSIGAVVVRKQSGASDEDEYNPENPSVSSRLSSVIQVTSRPKRKLDANKKLLFLAMADAQKSMIQDRKEIASPENLPPTQTNERIVRSKGNILKRRNSPQDCNRREKSPAAKKASIKDRLGSHSKLESCSHTVSRKSVKDRLGLQYNKCKYIFNLCLKFMKSLLFIFKRYMQMETVVMILTMTLIEKKMMTYKPW